MTNSILRSEILTSQPIKFKDTQLRLRSQVLQLRLPVASGGLIWNRPVAVLVSYSAGQEHILPVPDPTRTVVLALVGLCIATTFLTMLFRRKNA